MEMIRSSVRAIVRKHSRLVLIAVVGLAYFAGLAVALRLEWYPQALPGYFYLGACAIVGAATVGRWPVETLVVVTAFTAYTTLAPLPPSLYGLYVGPPTALVPLAIVAFLSIAHRGPVVAPAATFGTLAVLVIPPWRDISADLSEGDPLSQALLLDAGYDRSVLLAEFVACALLLAVALLLGRQRQATEELEAKNRELLQLRAGEEERIAAQERARIARDMHDEVAHHVAALVIRAQASLRVAEHRPDQLALAMQDIAEGGQDVLGRIRGVVRVLKATPTDPRRAAPTLEEELEALFDRVRSIGYDVDFSMPANADISPVHRLAIVGIVQESLTNTMLHSSARSMGVTVEERPSTWTVAVTDPGPARERFPDVPTGGSGIPSMRERTSLLGGRLTTGADSVGTGWSVHLELPRGTVSPQKERVS